MCACVFEWLRLILFFSFLFFNLIFFGTVAASSYDSEQQWVLSDLPCVWVALWGRQADLRAVCASSCCWTTWGKTSNGAAEHQKGSRWLLALLLRRDKQRGQIPTAAAGSYLCCRRSLIPFLVFPNLWPGRGLKAQDDLWMFSFLFAFYRNNYSSTHRAKLNWNLSRII